MKENSAEADVEEFLNRNKKHRGQGKEADEEFDLEDPSEYEKEAEDYSIDTLDAYSSAMQRHSDGNSITQVLSQDEEKEKEEKEY